MRRRYVLLLGVLLALIVVGVAVAARRKKPWSAQKCANIAKPFNRCLSMITLKKALMVKYGAPNTPLRDQRCRRKYTSYVTHCLDFQLTQCTGVCNATTPAQVTNCQVAIQKACEAMTRPMGSTRLLEEEEGEEQLTHRGSLDGTVADEGGSRELSRQRGRGLLDASCPTSPAFMSAIASGDPMVLVQGFSVGSPMQSMEQAAMVACQVPDVNCDAMLCALGVSTTTNPTPGQAPPSVSVDDFDPNDVPGMPAGLLCSASSPCASGQCCDGAGVCRPGTQDKFCSLSWRCVECSAGQVCQGANGCVDLYQQLGSKLVGTGAHSIAPIYQGLGVALSADSSTVAIGGYGDSSNVGATWLYRLSNGAYTQVGNKLVGTGAAMCCIQQGRSVHISSDGSTLAIGGIRDGNYYGGTWIYTRINGSWTQFGGKLYGTGAVGNPTQGSSVSLSADGSVVAIGGGTDSGAMGATWIFTLRDGAYLQFGSKLVGTGGVGSPYQGSGVSLSADGGILAVGGYRDNGGRGATWVFKLMGGEYTQIGSKLIGEGAVGTSIYQGYSVRLSLDGSTLAVGGPGDNGNTGASWLFNLSFSDSSGSDAITPIGSKLVGAGSTVSNSQGRSVSLSSDGSMVVVGAPGYTSGQGTAWVFRRNSSGLYSQVGSRLQGRGVVGSNNIYQGQSVSLSPDGSTVAVGGYGDNSSIGALWIYKFNASRDTYTQFGDKLVGSGMSGPVVYQGYSVSLSHDGSTVAVGGPLDSNQVGGTWVFQLLNHAYTQVGSKLVGTGFSPAVYQGYSVSLSSDGSIVAIGGPVDNSNKGAVWIFTYSNGAYTQFGSKLVGTGASGSIVEQGTSVSLSADGSVVAIGGWRDSSDQGAVWVFKNTGGGGAYIQVGSKLVGTGMVGSALQGQAVSISADASTVAVGGPQDGSGARATWIFTRTSEGTYTQYGDKLVGLDAVGVAGQGTSISLSKSGAMVAVGGPTDDSYTGATWMFQCDGNGGNYTQVGSKLVGTSLPTARKAIRRADGGVAAASSWSMPEQPGGGVPVMEEDDLLPWAADGRSSPQSGRLIGAMSSSQGQSVSMSWDGSVVAVGGPNDNDGDAAGATRVFKLTDLGSYAQVGSKLVGTGRAGPAQQGFSVSLSSDGLTVAVGGPIDDSTLGGCWIFQH